MTMKAWLEGDQLDLQDLVDLLPSGDVRVVREGEAYHLSAPEIKIIGSPRTSPPSPPSAMPWHPRRNCRNSTQADRAPDRRTIRQLTLAGAASTAAIAVVSGTDSASAIPPTVERAISMATLSLVSTSLRDRLATLNSSSNGNALPA